MRKHLTAVTLVLLAAAALQACAPDGSPTGSRELRVAADAVGDRNDVYSVVPGVLNVCAFYPGNADGVQPPATFSAAAAPGEDVLSGSFEIVAPPHCIEVWNATHAGDVSVSASLVSASAGWQVDRVYRAMGDGSNPETAEWFDGVTTVSATVSSSIGGYVWFKFKPADIPPPQSGQGCTPGYWRQAHHYDSWTAPYSPTTPFSDVFANAFPGKTLSEVVRLGGGGINALGRMAVAALLNAASSNVSYDYSTAQVISEFNAVYASGNRGRIEDVKNVLDMLNNQGCPLN